MRMRTMALSVVVLLACGLASARTWYPPDGPVNVEVKADRDARLVLTNFAGEEIKPDSDQLAEVKGTQTVDLKKVFTPLISPGTYVLYVVPKGKPASQFVGTP